MMHCVRLEHGPHDPHTGTLTARPQFTVTKHIKKSIDIQILILCFIYSHTYIYKDIQYKWEV